jgi:hypothetical protein
MMIGMPVSAHGVSKLGLDTLWNLSYARGVIAATIDAKSDG